MPNVLWSHNRSIGFYFTDLLLNEIYTKEKDVLFLNISCQTFPVDGSPFCVFAIFFPQRLFSLSPLHAEVRRSKV